MGEQKRSDDIGLREKLDIEYQVNEQMKMFRWAFSQRNTDAMTSAGVVLTDLLWNHFTGKERDRFNAASPKELTSSDFYNEEDRNELSHFSTLGGRRLKEISAFLKKRNKELIFQAWSRKIQLIYSVADRLGIGFESVEDANIDKKKVTFSAKKSFRGSMRTSTRKNETGSAPS